MPSIQIFKALEALWMTEYPGLSKLRLYYLAEN